MYQNPSTHRWTLIGTVQGAGYNCRKDSMGMFEGSTNGVWNKVTAHMKWIRKTMEGLGETVCQQG